MARTTTRTTRTRRVTRTATAPREIFVKVAKTGGIVTEVCLNGSRTVEDALVAAKLKFSASDRVRVNGRQAELSQNLRAGDNVTISGKIQGGKN